MVGASPSCRFVVLRDERLLLPVAITRAQAMLIVVGDPTVLSLDPTWRGFLNYVYEKGGWRGKAIGWNPKAPLKDGGYDWEMQAEAHAQTQEMLQRLKSVILTELDPVVDPEDVGGGSDYLEDGEAAIEEGAWKLEE
jgi:helicase MOV-10